MYKTMLLSSFQCQKTNFLQEPQHVYWEDCIEHHIAEAKLTNGYQPCHYTRRRQAPNSIGCMMLQSEKADQYIWCM